MADPTIPAWAESEFKRVNPGVKYKKARPESGWDNLVGAIHGLFNFGGGPATGASRPKAGGGSAPKPAAGPPPDPVQTLSDQVMNILGIFGKPQTATNSYKIAQAMQSLGINDPKD